ncbi:MAG TPA: hypothetical protein VKB58_12995 [Terriglobales bacterium]|jgi:hypothetical protein|nr:hypothetical protein [Terriglobales bacterium]
MFVNEGAANAPLENVDERIPILTAMEASLRLPMRAIGSFFLQWAAAPVNVAHWS